MKNVKGKFYIRLVGAYAVNYFWNDERQLWMHSPSDASFYDTREHAQRVSDDIDGIDGIEDWHVVQALCDLP